MRRSGFTLVEMLTVIVVLATLAAIMSPNLAASVKANAKRTYLSSVDRLPTKARQMAVSSGVTTTLIADEDGNLALEQQVDEASDPQRTDQVSAIDDLVPDTFVLQGEESASTEWQIRFFPDGTSDRGGIQFDENGNKWSLTVDGHGKGKVSSGELPENTEDRWEAGDIVQRT